MKKTAEKKVVEKKAVARRPAKAKDNLLLAREHKQAQEDLDALYESWEELSEAVAELD